MNKELHIAAGVIVRLLDARTTQKENLTTRIIRDYVDLGRRFDGQTAAANKVREGRDKLALSLQRTDFAEWLDLLITDTDLFADCPQIELHDCDESEGPEPDHADEFDPGIPKPGM